MPALQVKDCPSDVYEQLKASASQDNRSISQQALTIIEDYLGFRDDFASSRSKVATEPETTRCSGSLPSRNRCDYVAHREAIFSRIAKLRPLPISDKSPDSSELLRQVREEDAR